MPRAGGQYVFLREGLGPLWGFLYGWTLFVVIQTGTIAAVAIAFARFAGVREELDQEQPDPARAGATTQAATTQPAGGSNAGH